jgi:hypothetical protein
LNSRAQTAVWLVSLALGVCAVVEAQPQNAAQRRRLVPQDEGRRAPGFAQAIQRFEKAVRARDATAIVGMLDERVVFSIGSEDVGPRAFRKYRKLDERSSEFWTVAEDLLKGGSALGGDCSSPQEQCYVTYPFWFDRFPDQDLTRFDHLVVRRENVPMYATARADAPVVERLSYEIVKLRIDPTRSPNDTWTDIALLDGRTGAVRSSDLYYPAADYRLTFGRLSSGRWVLGSFLAGD